MANTINDVGLFLGTTRIFDLQQVQEALDTGSEEETQLKIALYQAVNDIINAMNIKETGYYLSQEFVIGSLYFNTANDFNNLRPVYRMVVDFGALPAAGTKSVAHEIPDIDAAFSFVKIYATASDPVALTYIPIPYASANAVADNLEITVDNTNVNITTGGTDYSAYTTTYVVLEYIKE